MPRNTWRSARGPDVAPAGRPPPGRRLRWYSGFFWYFLRAMPERAHVSGGSATAGGCSAMAAGERSSSPAALSESEKRMSQGIFPDAGRDCNEWIVSRCGRHVGAHESPREHGMDLASRFHLRSEILGVPVGGRCSESGAVFVLCFGTRSPPQGVWQSRPLHGNPNRHMNITARRPPWLKPVPPAPKPPIGVATPQPLLCPSLYSPLEAQCAHCSKWCAMSSCRCSSRGIPCADASGRPTLQPANINPNPKSGGLQPRALL